MRTGDAKAHGLVETRINYWPSLVDLMASVITVMVLVNVLQLVMVNDAEAARARAAQLRLLGELEAHFQGPKKPVFALSPNLLQINFTDTVLFGTAKYEMTKESAAVIARTAKVLIDSQVDYQQVQVEGHTDSDPFPPGVQEYPTDNWELSSARATYVLKALQAAHIPPVKLSATGYADTRPVSTHKNMNRRIELRILFVTPTAQGTP